MLQNFSSSGAFDVVLSLNVLEHFHPDDVVDHLRDVHRSLKKGGEYILKTPHRFFGPHGIERIFGVTDNRGLHLREYTYADVNRLAEQSGFCQSLAVWSLPMPVRRIVRKLNRGFIRRSRAYMEYLVWIEKRLEKIHNPRDRTRTAMVFRFLMLPRQVFVILKK